VGEVVWAGRATAVVVNGRHPPNTTLAAHARTPSKDRRVCVKFVRPDFNQKRDFGELLPAIGIHAKGRIWSTAATIAMRKGSGTMQGVVSVVNNAAALELVWAHSKGIVGTPEFVIMERFHHSHAWAASRLRCIYVHCWDWFSFGEHSKKKK
jgi:hypothetical protein